MPADEPGRTSRRTALTELYSKVSHADTVAALSLPARGRSPTLADIEAFVRRG
jgi:hypothetical protein